MVRTLGLAYLNEEPDRHGTFTHIDYQRRGLATWLTKHCNEIADAEGRRTWVNVLRQSKHLFTTNGFDFIESREFDLTPAGGSEIVVNETYRRDPTVINASMARSHFS